VVEVALDEGVATIGLGRPEQMNALDFEAKNALLTALSRAGESDAVRAVLLTAEGRGFCVGQDLREFLAERDRVPTEQLFTTVRDHFNPLCELVASMNKPVVAAVQGAAAGAGLSLALAADFRVASATATFTTAFTGIALSPDTGMTWHLPRLVGSAKATELMMLSPTLSAEEALRIGLVTQVVAPDELATVARQMALRLAQGPTRAWMPSTSLSLNAVPRRTTSTPSGRSSTSANRTSADGEKLHGQPLPRYRGRAARRNSPRRLFAVPGTARRRNRRPSNEPNVSTKGTGQG
jgi:2-(1,2-epoxy-1,2-dihydrophenyl)acetyl-CoA isomerase